MGGLPKLNYRRKGFRNVRGLVCKRIHHRTDELNLSCTPQYRDLPLEYEEEGEVLDSLCCITISRFYRDRKAFQVIESEPLPLLIRRAERQQRKGLCCWSIDCCSEEEPSTLELIWQLAAGTGWGLEDSRHRIYSR